MEAYDPFSIRVSIDGCVVSSHEGIDYENVACLSIGGLPIDPLDGELPGDPAIPAFSYTVALRSVDTVGTASKVLQALVTKTYDLTDAAITIRGNEADWLCRKCSARDR
jgi:hypothetical protein